MCTYAGPCVHACFQRGTGHRCVLSSITPPWVGRWPPAGVPASSRSPLHHRAQLQGGSVPPCLKPSEGPLGSWAKASIFGGLRGPAGLAHLSSLTLRCVFCHSSQVPLASRSSPRDLDVCSAPPSPTHLLPPAPPPPRATAHPAGRLCDGTHGSCLPFGEQPPPSAVFFYVTVCLVFSTSPEGRTLFILHTGSPWHTVGTQ